MAAARPMTSKVGHDRPAIALVQGDPGGIGPELLVHLLGEASLRRRARIIVIGAPSVLEGGERVVGTNLSLPHVSCPPDADWNGGVLHLDLRIEGVGDVPKGQASAAGGRSSLKGLETAFTLARDGVVQAICFMPFNKESMKLGGNLHADELGFARDFFGITGHTGEFNFAHGMWNARVTSHVPMREVPSLLTEARICDAILLADHTLRTVGYARPRIVVAAYNPHAGEGGLMGCEEIKVIRPAVAAMAARQVDVSGPLPADTLWLKLRDGQFDVAVTMYHDQGQIAIKLLGFEQGISLLAGLPVPVCTPAHGTAFDIAGTNSANPAPARNAFMMACDLAEGRPRHIPRGVDAEAS